MWLNDITGPQTGEGKLKLCAIKGAHSNRIFDHWVDLSMKARLAANAFDFAVARRRAKGILLSGCVVRSDRGLYSRSRKFVHALVRHSMIGSMGRVGACGDNAAMESFFALLQKNVLDRQHCTTRNDLRIAIITRIERTYHRRLRQAGLGRLTLIEYEAIVATPATRAV